ncbi:hypothetical protein EK904_002199 [Melospiza melodia maxima]|nr:hypothetical protein EK904_002199 [Melospiza melodia maxima]
MVGTLSFIFLKTKLRTNGMLLGAAIVLWIEMTSGNPLGMSWPVKQLGCSLREPRGSGIPAARGARSIISALRNHHGRRRSLSSLGNSEGLHSVLSGWGICWWFERSSLACCGASPAASAAPALVGAQRSRASPANEAQPVAPLKPLMADGISANLCRPSQHDLGKAQSTEMKHCENTVRSFSVWCCLPWKASEHRLVLPVWFGAVPLHTCSEQG